jgi:hypothetical protein
VRLGKKPNKSLEQRLLVEDPECIRITFRRKLDQREYSKYVKRRQIYIVSLRSTLSSNFWYADAANVL